MTWPLEGANIVFRADAGRRIGSGHLMRCLTLAEALGRLGARSLFVCRAHEGHMGAAIREKGHDLCLAPIETEYAAGSDHESWRGASLEDDVALTREAVDRVGGAAALIVDHYGLDRDFETALRPSVGAIIAIDDLADRPHDCDLLLDQNVGHAAELYDDLLPRQCRRLVGPSFAPLRPQFAAARPAALARRSRLTRPDTLLVAVGGSDQQDLTGRVLDAVDLGVGRFSFGHIHLVLTSMSPNLDTMRRRLAGVTRITLHVDTNQMPAIMAESDLAVGGLGVTALERCVMGLPSITLEMATNQAPAANHLQTRGAVVSAGLASTITAAELSDIIAAVWVDSARYGAMMAAALELCDGQGLSRVVPEIKAVIECATTSRRWG